MGYPQVTDLLFICNGVYFLRNHYFIRIRSFDESKGFSISLDSEDLRFKLFNVIKVTTPNEWFAYGSLFIGSTGDCIYLTKDFDNFYLNINSSINSLQVFMTYNEVQSLIDFIKGSEEF